MKKLINLLTILFISILNLSSCSKESFKNEQILNKIYVVSDTHLLSNNLISNKDAKTSLTSDGRVQELDYDILEGLVSKVNIDKPNYLIITGDLTLNGELDSHNEVIKILDKIEDTKVLVIPGNHDTYNLYSYDYINNKNISSISDAKFKELYKNYGYNNDAISYDSLTNSYFYKLDDLYYGLFLDTTLNKYNDELGENIIGGGIEESTLTWIEDCLKIAQDNNKKVISFSHHNLFLHNSLFKYGYRISNYTDLVSLYNKYNVTINFSGHMHIQNIKYENNIYDIASGSLIDYGNRVGVIKTYNSGIDYKTFKLEIDNIDLEGYSYNTFYNKYYNKQSLDTDNYGKKAEKVKDMMCKINCYYFDGDYKSIYKQRYLHPSLYKKIKEKTNNNYWLSLLDVENKSQNELVVKY